MRHEPRFAIAVALAASLASLPAADACSFAGPEELVTDAAEMEADTAPPTALTVSVDLVRGQGPQGGCGGDQTATSCDDMGIIKLTVAATDDRTPATELGYEIVLVDGALPEGLALPPGPIVARDRVLYLHWVDGATDDQEPLDLALSVTAVDRAGNRGAMAMVAVEHEGRSARHAASAALLVAGLLLVRKRPPAS